MSNLDQKCLIYIAGDVSNYSPVKYKFADKEVTSFFSAHALSKIFEVEKIIALLPDSLIQHEKRPMDIETMKKGYKKLVLDRTNFLKNKGDINEQTVSDIESFISDLTIEVIPNVGIGQAIKVDKNGEVLKTEINGKQELQRSPYSESRNPVFIFNVIYTIFHENKSYEILLDLTHGTNVLTSTALTTGALFKTRFFAAPIMAPIQNEVNIVELTEIVEAMKDSLMINSSIQELDERYFRDYRDKLNSPNLNPNNFNEEKTTISKIKGKDPGKVIDLLWNLRNGFTVSAVHSMCDVEHYSQQLEKDVNELSNYYREWYNHKSLENIKELVISNFYSTLEVRNILIPGNDIDKLHELISLYIKAKLYDKALSLARELPVATCLDSNGGGKFDDNNRKYKDCEDLVTSYLRLKHGELIEKRNYLMHGGLSKDMKVNVKDGNINEENPIKRENIEKYIKESLESDLEDIIKYVKDSSVL